MSVIDYKALRAMHKPKYFVSREAHQVANELINEVYVQNGYGLAPFLGLDSSFENHKAIRIWVQQQLDSGQYGNDEFSNGDIICHLSNELKKLCAFNY